MGKNADKRLLKRIIWNGAEVVGVTIIGRLEAQQIYWQMLFDEEKASSIKYLYRKPQNTTNQRKFNHIPTKKNTPKPLNTTKQ